MAGGSLGAVVNKKALAETPKEALNWYMWFVCWTVCTSGGLHGYNSSNISGILKVSPRSACPPNRAPRC